MARYHGVNSDTYKELLIDSGLVYKNYGEAGEVALGATRGGATLSIETELRTMEADGAHGPVKGDKRIVSVTGKLAINQLELDKDFLNDILAGSTATDETTYYKLVRSLQIALADYLTNIAVIAEVTGNATVPFGFILDNALSTGNLEVALSDKEESVVSAEFTGHFDPSDLDTEPWEIRWPKITA